MKKRVLLKDNQNNELYPRPCLSIGILMLFGNTFDPNTYFMGTWEKIEKVFFMASSSDFPVGQVSGSNTHTLTVDEMPKHRHDITQVAWNPDDNADLLHYESQTQGSTSMFKTGYTGGSKPFDIKPRRYAVNAWVRVS